MQWIGCVAIAVLLLWSGSGLAEQRQALPAPVNATCISSPFGPRTLPNRPQAGSYHYGIDLPAPEGSPVRAITAGVLLRVQHNGPGGLEVLVQHAGFVAVYSHLGLIAPRLDAGSGVAINAGEWLGIVGRTGVSFGPHLYFGMWRDGRPVDPAPLLRMRLCGGSRSPGPAATLAADGDNPLPGTAATADEQPPVRRSSLLDDFPPSRGCTIASMVKIAPSRFYVGRDGDLFGRTGIARYACPGMHGPREQTP